MHEILIWHVDLRGSEDVRRRCWQLLAHDERARAERFHAAIDRARYVVARGALRSILGEYVGAPPDRLEFHRSPFGKPSLAGGAGVVPDFNVSRALDIMVCAIAEGARVGVDIETVIASAATHEATYFSAKEREDLARLPPDMRPEAVAVCWTRKEAFIKARGEGLSFPLHAFDVSVYPDPPRLLATRPDRDEAARWSLHDLAMGNACVGTVAIEGQGWTIKRLEWRAVRD